MCLKGAAKESDREVVVEARGGEAMVEPSVTGLRHAPIEEPRKEPRCMLRLRWRDLWGS